MQAEILRVLQASSPVDTQKVAMSGLAESHHPKVRVRIRDHTMATGMQEPQGLSVSALAARVVTIREARQAANRQLGLITAVEAIEKCLRNYMYK